MAFPSNTGSIPLTPSESLAQIRRMAGIVKMNASRERAASASGPIGCNQVVGYVGELAEHKDVLSALVIDGLVAFAQAQLGQNITADYAAMVNAIDATIAAIVGGLPKDGQGNLIEKKLGTDGRVQMNTFASNDPLMVGYRSVLDALIATIN